MVQQTKTNKTTQPESDPLGEEPANEAGGVNVRGGAAGAVIGGLAGAVGGPIGAALGAMAGAVVGGYGTSEAPESIDLSGEDAFWRVNYRTRPYVDASTPYEEYQPAFRYGWEARANYSGRRFEEIEPELERGWVDARRGSHLEWSTARLAALDAWDRIDRLRTGDIPATDGGV
ncbi:MAG TPA: hypothetical protein VGY53_03040 [Isosphaeraceae bacterium]|nr:hypothetical protein [Isosphaeraceae bacterium]